MEASSRKLNAVQTIPSKGQLQHEESVYRSLPQTQPAHPEKPRVQTLILRKNMQSILENVSKLQNISNKTILDTKRGKNNPSSVFQKPKNAQDPIKQQLARVYSNEPVPNSRVPVGTYDTQRYNQIGDQARDDKLLDKLKTREYSMYKMETKNKAWIEKARKNYEAKYEKQTETVEQFVEACGF